MKNFLGYFTLFYVGPENQEFPTFSDPQFFSDSRVDQVGPTNSTHSKIWEKIIGGQKKMELVLHFKNNFLWNKNKLKKTRNFFSYYWYSAKSQKCATGFGFKKFIFEYGCMPSIWVEGCFFDGCFWESIVCANATHLRRFNIDGENGPGPKTRSTPPSPNH